MMDSSLKMENSNNMLKTVFKKIYENSEESTTWEAHIQHNTVFQYLFFEPGRIWKCKPKFNE
jgi:hypothetical protein